MAYDWERLEREERDRIDRSGLALGAVWLVSGLAGLVLTLTGRDNLLIGSALWLLMGLSGVLAYLGLRRRRRRAQQPPPQD